MAARAGHSLLTSQLGIQYNTAPATELTEPEEVNNLVVGPDVGVLHLTRNQIVLMWSSNSGHVYLPWHSLCLGPRIYQTAPEVHGLWSLPQSYPKHMICDISCNVVLVVFLVLAQSFLLGNQFLNLVSFESLNIIRLVQAHPITCGEVLPSYYTGTVSGVNKSH